jgi:cbb3-type cytochrome oxidase maturation protein
LYFLIPFSFLLAGIGLGAYIYAVRSGQFSDLDSPSKRLIFDDMDLVKEENLNESE